MTLRISRYTRDQKVGKENYLNNEDKFNDKKDIFNVNQPSKPNLKYKCTICNTNFSKQKYLDVHTKCHFPLKENEEKSALKPKASNYYIAI